MEESFNRKVALYLLLIGSVSVIAAGVGWHIVIYWAGIIQE
jgi:hypothetical protein